MFPLLWCEWYWLFEQFLLYGRFLSASGFGNPEPLIETARNLISWAFTNKPIMSSKDILLCNKSLPHACQQPPMRFLVFAHLCVGLWHFLHWALGRSGCSRSFRRGTVNDMKNRMGWHPSYIQVGPVSRCQHCLHHRHRCYRKNRNVSTSRSRNEMNTKSRAGPKQYRKIWLEHQSNCHV